MTQRPRVLFLGGIGRSGTTLLERTIAETEGICALGEVLHLWERGVRQNELCGCGEPFHACPFWSEVGRVAFGGWDLVDLDRVATLKTSVDRALRVPLHRSRFAAGVRTEAAEYAGWFIRLYRAAAEVTGQTLVDSSKQVSLASCVQTTGAVDLRVLHCVRDSRAVAYSWTQEVRRPEAADEEHALMARFSPARLSSYWMLHNAELDALSRVLPVQRHRYEDFVRDPGVELRRALSFGGHPGAAAAHVHDHAVTLRPSHTSAGNPMRFRSGTIEIRSDDRWRTGLPDAQRRLVTSLTAPLLMRYGYLGGRSDPASPPV